MGQGDILAMSQREIERYKVIQNVLDHRLKQREAALFLNLSRRQIIRLCHRTRQKGARGLIHGLRGRPSNHQLPPGTLEKALALVKTRYPDFGPTFATEKLEERHGLDISVTALRQAMIHQGLWKARKPRERHRAWRERRPCVGLLIQLDGSDHPWFEDRGPRCVLLLFIDDATGRILHGEFVPAEDTVHLLGAVKAYLLAHGRPVAFYVDKDSIYRINRQASMEEDLRNEYPLTQFTRAMKELDVDVIFAHSPQAKGRVERSFQTHQDRLVKELRLAGISTIPEANPFLRGVYIPKHNARFAVPPASPANAHRPLLKSQRLEEILSLRSPRTIANDFTVRYNNQFFQLLKDQPCRVRPGQTVLIEARLDGSILLRFKDRYLNVQRVARRPYKPFYATHKAPSTCAKPLKLPWRPPMSHPWKAASFQEAMRRKTAVLTSKNLLTSKT